MVNLVSSDVSAWRDADVTVEAAEVMDPAREFRFLESGAGSEHVKVAIDPLQPEAERASDASPDSEAAIDFTASAK